MANGSSQWPIGRRQWAVGSRKWEVGSARSPPPTRPRLCALARSGRGGKGGGGLGVGCGSLTGAAGTRSLVRVFVQQADRRQMSAPFPACIPGRAQDARDPGPRRRRPGALVTTRNLHLAPRRRTEHATSRAGHDVDEEQLAQENLSPIGPARRRRDPGSARCRAPAGEAREGPPLTLTLSPRARNALGGEGRTAVPCCSRGRVSLNHALTMVEANAVRVRYWCQVSGRGSQNGRQLVHMAFARSDAGACRAGVGGNAGIRIADGTHGAGAGGSCRQAVAADAGATAHP